MLEVALLGCGGSMPMANRYLTSLLVSYGGRMLLIDCGEGTQVSIKLLKWGFKSIDAICFTHYHADHVVGFPGLLLTIANSGREEPLTVIGPPGLREVVAGLRVIVPYLPFELKLFELKDDKAGFAAVGNFKLEAQPVEHSMPCLSYKLEVERMRKFDREKAEQENVPMEFWNRLRKGEEIKHQGRILTQEMILGEARKGLKLCYCTDTRPVESLIPFIKEVDLFICEGMYGEDEFLSKALENKHMLFSEAAALAMEGKVRELWLTHFSPSLLNPEDYLEKTRSIFKNTFLGQDRLTKTLNFSE